MKGDEGWWRVDLLPSPSGTPINTGNFKEKMKGEGYLRHWFFFKTDIDKMPTCGTIVPLRRAQKCPLMIAWSSLSSFPVTSKGTKVPFDEQWRFPLSLPRFSVSLPQTSDALRESYSAAVPMGWQTFIYTAQVSQVLPHTPCKGKSFKLPGNLLGCCRYRAHCWLPLYPGRCPGLRASAPSGRIG